MKGEDNGAADGLSRLPLDTPGTQSEEQDYLNLVCEDKLPLSADDIRKATRVDPELSKVYQYVRDRWPSEGNTELTSYRRRTNELSIEKGVLMWGYRVVIPNKFHKFLLEEIHGTHMGMNKMKAIARQYFWWPNLDADIEQFVKGCNQCRMFAKNPEKARLEKFPEARRPFERIHIDFLGPFKGKVYLVIIDAYSKWPEIFEMPSTDTGRTIEKLREVCSRFGLPEMLISDNGTQFQSSEFAEFCKNNGIIHRTSPPYHPATNGQAENMVGTFKNCMKRILEDKANSNIKVSTLVLRFLASYRNTPHATTRETPARKMLGREVRTRLTFLHKPRADSIAEDQKKYFHGHRDINFEEGENVYMRNYKNPMKPTWKKATIKTNLGYRTFICEPEDGETLAKRHTDQLVKRGSFYSADAEKIKVSVSDSAKENQEPKMDNAQRESTDNDRERTSIPRAATNPTVQGPTRLKLGSTEVDREET